MAGPTASSAAPILPALACTAASVNSPRTIRDDSRAGLTRNKGRAIGSGGQLLVSFGRGIGGRQARRCHDDGVG
jgi:hypothetical protein